MKDLYNKTISYIALDRIQPDYENVRTSMTMTEDDELAESIQNVGLISPLIVYPVYNDAKLDYYKVVSGHRRLKALNIIDYSNEHNKAPFRFDASKVKCIVLKDTNPATIKQIQIIENIQRVDLKDFEICQGVIALWNTGRYEKKRDLAQAIGKSESYISKCFNIDKNLDESIKEDLQQSKDPVGISKLDELARQPKEIQKEIIEDVKKGNIKRDEIKQVAKNEAPYLSDYIDKADKQDHNEDFKTFPVKIEDVSDLSQLLIFLIDSKIDFDYSKVSHSITINLKDTSFTYAQEKSFYDSICHCLSYSLYNIHHLSTQSSIIIYVKLDED
ncbi:MAG: ParB/RepB/Spo0J family partition protein [Campylobacterota bacterium]|nr:ParB/RepB/Spo0J family partition protein [Campylobacterota bacterium]